MTKNFATSLSKSLKCQSRLRSVSRRIISLRFAKFLKQVRSSKHTFDVSYTANNLQ